MFKLNQVSKIVCSPFVLLIIQTHPCCLQILLADQHTVSTAHSALSFQALRVDGLHFASKKNFHCCLQKYLVKIPQSSLKRFNAYKKSHFIFKSCNKGLLLVAQAGFIMLMKNLNSIAMSSFQKFRCKNFETPTHPSKNSDDHTPCVGQLELSSTTEEASVIHRLFAPYEEFTREFEARISQLHSRLREKLQQNACSQQMLSSFKNGLPSLEHLQKPTLTQGPATISENTFTALKKI